MTDGRAPAAFPPTVAPVGFRVIVRGDAVALHTRNPGRGAPLASTARAADCQAVLFGDLYYRRTLRNSLPADPAPVLEGGGAEDDSNTAVALALHIYRAQGWQGLARLEGDFSLVIWDAARRWLIGVRDPMGGYPLFWIRQPGFYACATGLRDLLALLPRRPGP